MKRIIYLILFMFLTGFLFFSPAGAGALEFLQVTITPTNTFIPPSPTSTPANNTTCPIGTPAGWGTYTPSPLWLLECGNCSSVVGTGTPSPSPTPLYSPTPLIWYTTTSGTPFLVPSVTPTITATPAGLPSHGSMVMSCVSPTAPNVSGSAVLTYPNNYSCLYTFTNWRGASGVFGQGLRMTSGLSGTPSLHNPGSSVSYDFWGTYDLTFQYEIDFVNTDNPERYPFVVSAVFDVVNALVPADVTYTNYLSVSGQSWRYYQPPVFFDDNSNLTTGWTVGGSSAWSNDVIVNGIVSLYYDGYSPLVSTPTPSPSPTAYFDSGYCSTVANPQDSGFGFDLFVPDGEANCDLGWAEFGVGDNTIPAVQICFQPSQVGVIKLFGQEFEVGVFALAAAAAFLWRFLRTV